MGQGPVHVVFILMLPGASVQPGCGALVRADNGTEVRSLRSEAEADRLKAELWRGRGARGMGRMGRMGRDGTGDGKRDNGLGGVADARCGISEEAGGLHVTAHGCAWVHVAAQVCIRLMKREKDA
jgi:hypothetical protein